MAGRSGVLEYRGLIGLDAQPTQAIKDYLHVFFGGPLAIGIFDP